MNIRTKMNKKMTLRHQEREATLKRIDALEEEIEIILQLSTGTEEWEATRKEIDALEKEIDALEEKIEALEISLQLSIETEMNKLNREKFKPMMVTDASDDCAYTSLALLLAVQISFILGKPSWIFGGNDIQWLYRDLSDLGDYDYNKDGSIRLKIDDDYDRTTPSVTLSLVEAMLIVNPKISFSSAQLSAIDDLVDTYGLDYYVEVIK